MRKRPILERELAATMRVVLCCVLVVVVTAAVATASTTHEYYGKPYLTWQGDPSTTMTINFHTQQPLESVAVVYGLKSDGDTYEHRAEGASRQIPRLADSRHVHSVELTGLKAGEVHAFRIELPEGLSPVYTFKTIPEGCDPVRFAVGGDALATPIFSGLVKNVAKQEPLFLVIGGDLAYANGDVKQIGRWDLWFAAWHKYGTTPEGRLIPLVMAIGNHETKGPKGSDEVRAPFYFGFFPQGGKSFFARQFSANLGMIVLDSGHLAKHESQVEFLEEQLKRFAELPFRVAVYHVPLYPSYRPYDGKSQTAGRTHWLPLFDAHGLTIGFEHHDHTFKRTKRLRNNELNSEGTLYVGDGSAGVVSRKPKEDRWYIEKTSSESHLWIVDVSPDKIHLSAMNRKGEIFDEATVEPAAAVIAE